MNIKKELNKMLIGYKIKHPNEELSQILSNILIQDNLYDFFRKQDNFFKINEELNIDNINKEIIKIMYEEWCSNLEDIDYFIFSSNYAIFTADNNVNIIGHIEIEELNEIINNLIKKMENKENTKIIFYPIICEGTFEIDGIKVDVSERGIIKVHGDAEYGRINNEDKKFNNIRYIIYFKTAKYLKGENIDKETIEEIIYYFSEEYIKTIDINEVLEENGFKIFDNAYQKITNTNGIKLQNKTSGKLLEGKIDISVDRGYQTHLDMPQQDSALSIVKNKDIFLNIIADGAGKSERGEKASKLIIKELEEWFKIMPEELFYNLNVLIELLKLKIVEVDEKITQEYKKSYTTIVLALTVYDKTIIANVGDSTAYTYNKENNKLVLLTELDSDSKDMEYEEARFNPWNNMITAAIGDGYKKDIHINIIDNKGQKIIISSDGITDLISEERFKSYFINNIDSSKIVNDALSKKDTKYLDKDEDNISVIIIKLPNYKQKKLV